MRTNRLIAVVCTLAFSGSIALAQGAQGEIQSLLAAVGASMAESKQSLARYRWIQQTQMLKDGESKGTTVQQIQMGPDGQPIKITLSSPPPPPKQRGLRGRVMKKEAEDMKQYVQQMTALAEGYVKPNPAVLQQQLAAGQAWMNPSPDGSSLQLKFNSVQKAGDSLTISLDTRNKQVRQIVATSYLSSPQDAISISAGFQDLPDGTDYMATMNVTSQQKGLQVQVVTLDYSLVGGP